MAYDELNRVRVRFNKYLEKTYFEYDARSSTTRQIDPEGRATYLAYDPARRLFHQSNALGELSYFLHDARGSRTQLINPRGYSTYWRYDLLARNTHREHALGGVSYTGYDEVGNVILRSDELGKSTYLTYDRLNRITHSKDQAAAVTYFAYDSRGAPRLRRDPDNRNTYFFTGSPGQIAEIKFANGVAGETADPAIYYRFNTVRELQWVDDRLRGLELSYFDYDRAGRVTKKTTIAGSVYYAYDASGMKTSLRDPGMAINYYYYDDAARLIAETLDNARRVYFAYDLSGQVTRRLLPGGVSSSLPHRVMAYYTYDEAGRVERVANLGPSANAVINYFQYERDANGQPVRIWREDGAVTYLAYDALDRLTMEQQFSSGGVTDLSAYYQYDLAGNRTYKLDNTSGTLRTYYSYDARNLLTTETIDGTAVEYTWDSAQRLASRKVAGGYSTYYAHDQLDRVRSVETKPSVGDDDKQDFGFNGVGERVSVRPGTSTGAFYYAYDGKKPLTAGSSGGSTINQRWRHNDVAPHVVGALVEKDPVLAGARSYPAMDGEGTVLKRCEDAGELEAVSKVSQLGETISNDYSSLPQDPNLRWLTWTGLFRSFWETADELYVTPGAELYRPGSASLSVGLQQVALGWIPNRAWLEIPKGANPGPLPPPMGPPPPPWADNRLLFVVGPRWDGVWAQERPPAGTAPVGSPQPGGTAPVSTPLPGGTAPVGSPPTLPVTPKGLGWFTESYPRPNPSPPPGTVGLSGLVIDAFVQNCPKIEWVQVVATNALERGCQKSPFVDPCVRGSRTDPFYYDPASNADTALRAIPPALAARPDVPKAPGDRFVDDPTKPAALPSITWSAVLALVCHCAPKKRIIPLYWIFWGWQAQGGVMLNHFGPRGLDFKNKLDAELIVKWIETVKRDFEPPWEVVQGSC